MVRLDLEPTAGCQNAGRLGDREYVEGGLLAAKDVAGLVCGHVKGLQRTDEVEFLHLVVDEDTDVHRWGFGGHSGRLSIIVRGRTPGLRHWRASVAAHSGGGIVRGCRSRSCPRRCG